MGNKTPKTFKNPRVKANYRKRGKNIKRVTVPISLEKSEKESQLKPWQTIPGPSSLPVIGQLHHFLPGGSLQNRNKIQDTLNETYGPIVRLDGLFGKAPFIFVFDPESCAQVLRGENWMPIRPGFDSLTYYRNYHNKNKDEALTPKGVITDQGENWKKIRSAVNPVLMQPKTIKLYSSALDDVALDMIQRLKSKRDDKQMIQKDFDSELNLWALESLGVVAFGRRLNCFDSNLPEDSYEKNLIRNIHDLFKIMQELDFQPSLWRLYSTRKFKKAMKLYEEQQTLAKYFVRKSMKELKAKSTTKSDSEKSVLEKLMEINEDMAVTMACDMLFAGVDTSSNVMLSILYLLASNPEKQDKLREELTSATSQEQRPYLKACIKEALRLKPAVPGNLRMTTKEYNLLGYRIPKNMNIIMIHQNICKMESQYPRPQEYIPERWIESKDSPIYYGNAHPFAYSPFGFGVRSCIGRRFAELEIETLLARIIQNFKLEWSGPPPEVVQKIVLVTNGPYNFTFKDV